MPPIAPRPLALIVVVASLAGARIALASTPGEIHTVFWQSDLSQQAAVDQFFGCLTESSSFTPTWGSQFGLSTITYDGSSVLTAAAPASLVMGGSLDQLITNAFDTGLLPPPKPGVNTEYIMMIPKGTIASDTMGATMCDNQGICGEHTSAQYNNLPYDFAMVPLECPGCGGGLDNTTITAEHEAAEGLADLGTAAYEVGDGCEAQNNITSLACCGTMYAIQQLAGAGGPNDCQTINATGSMCACKQVQSGCTATADCCSGLACKPHATADGGTPTLACCDDLGSACSTSADCCGALQCSSGHCACASAGHTCLSGADCCTELSCDTATHTCTAPSKPDAGSSGGGSGSGSSSGAGGGSSGTGGSGSGGSDVDAGEDSGAGATGAGGGPDATKGAAGCACDAAGRASESSGSGLLANLVPLALAMAARRRTRERASQSASRPKSRRTVGTSSRGQNTNT